MNYSDIIYANPAGNITAIVRGFEGSPVEKRTLAQEIMNAGKAEQVAYAMTPILGGDCRIEMMGGEFCGNATRAYGYLCTEERYDGGRYHLHVEISGASKPVLVQVNLDEATAFAQMPMPKGISMVRVEDREYPVVHMDGIDHMVVEVPMTQQERESFIVKALVAMHADRIDASGIMFLEEDQQLTPAVYVRETDSLVWESSCGSGSVASAWYQIYKMPGYDKSMYSITYKEPGGVLTVEVSVCEGVIVGCTMGGRIEISGESS